MPRATTAGDAGSACKCGHPEHHCRWCDRHFVVIVLRTDHEARCVARPVRGVA